MLLFYVLKKSNEDLVLEIALEKREGEEDDEAQVGAVFGLLAFYCHQN